MTDPKRIRDGFYWDEALSLVEGCTPCSPGCAHCWSAAQTHMRAGQKNEKIRARYGGLTNGKGCFNGTIRLMPESLKKLRRTKPTTFAVWNDLFHPAVDADFIQKALDAFAKASQHTILALTKRPGWYPGFLDKMSPNVWLGVTVCNQAEADEKIPILLDTPAAVRWVSIEPMLGPVDFTFSQSSYLSRQRRQSLDWVVLGPETGPGARPMDLGWARGVRDQCAAADIPFFYKGGKLDGRPHNELPEART